MVKVKAKVKESYDAIEFSFCSAISVGAFMECLAQSSDKELVFEVSFEKEEEKKTESRFIEPKEA